MYRVAADSEHQADSDEAPPPSRPQLRTADACVRPASRLSSRRLDPVIARRLTRRRPSPPRPTALGRSTRTLDRVASTWPARVNLVASTTPAHPHPVPGRTAPVTSTHSSSVARSRKTARRCRHPAAAFERCAGEIVRWPARRRHPVQDPVKTCCRPSSPFSDARRLPISWPSWRASDGRTCTADIKVVT